MKRNKEPEMIVAHTCLEFGSQAPVTQAILALLKFFPFSENDRRVEVDPGIALMAKLLLYLALSQIDRVVLQTKAMIDYCDAEGLDQSDYLDSLIKTKLSKKLHVKAFRAALGE